VGDSSDFKQNGVEIAVKAGCLVDDHRALVGGPWGAGIINMRSLPLRIADTIWRTRVTTVYHRGDTNYIGTLHGLWQKAGKIPAQFLGSAIPFLGNRISALTESDGGMLWVATYDAGVIGYARGRPPLMITPKQGLIGNVFLSLLLHDSLLWIGTDKGLNKVDLSKPGYPITCFTASDGLPSDVVNVIYAVGHRIFVGTSGGLSCFDETNTHLGDECRLNLLGATSSGRNRLGDTAGLLLPVREDNIRFDFIGISYRSAGKITYRYRLIGLDSNWKETGDNYLAYPTLPSGKYEFQVRAINRFGTQSEIRKVAFTIATPFWQQLWFVGCVLAVFLSLTWLFVTWRIRQVRRQQERKARQTRRMAELEHIALQSQMNPHFIFNCLNSIQQFVFDQDKMATNEYITGFARLIRATLNHSSRALITVAEEIEYLSDYLSLEKMRFKTKMDYRVEAEPGIDIQKSLLPPMLLQPYVENSVRHGLRHKKSGQGFLRIQFRKDDDHLVVVVQDNGIGRQKAMEYKTGEHIEYQSKGMSLTAARIQMLQALYHTEIQVQIEDLMGEKGQAEGTRIIIRFPPMREGEG
jgi:two-component sensor histidine kinase